MQDCAIAPALLPKSPQQAPITLLVDATLGLDPNHFYRLTSPKEPSNELIFKPKIAALADLVSLEKARDDQDHVRVEMVVLLPAVRAFVCGCARESNLATDIENRAALFRRLSSYLLKHSQENSPQIMRSYGRSYVLVQTPTPPGLRSVLPEDESFQVVYETDRPADYITHTESLELLSACMSVGPDDLCLQAYEVVLHPSTDGKSHSVNDLTKSLATPSAWIGIRSPSKDLSTVVRTACHSAFPNQLVLLRALSKSNIESNADAPLLRRELSRCLEQAAVCPVIVVLDFSGQITMMKGGVKGTSHMEIEPDGKVRRITPAAVMDNDDDNVGDRKVPIRDNWDVYFDGEESEAVQEGSQMTLEKVLRDWLIDLELIRDAVPNLRVCVRVEDRSLEEKVDVCIQMSAPACRLDSIRAILAAHLRTGSDDAVDAYLALPASTLQEQIPEHFRVALPAGSRDGPASRYIESIFEPADHTPVIYVKGAHGSGKTHVLKEMAGVALAMGIVPLWLNLATYLCAEVGGLQRRLEEIFRVASQHSRSLIFIDDWESFFVGEDSKYIDEGRKMFCFLCEDSWSGGVGVVCSGVCEESELISDLARLIRNKLGPEQWASL